MKYATLIVLLPLLGCGALGTAMETPADPLVPEGPTQAESVVSGVAGVAGAINPLAGAMVAAIGAAALGTYAKRKAS